MIMNAIVTEAKSIENVLRLCGELLEEHSWTLGVIAFDWAYRVVEMEAVKDYLILNHAQMPRTAYRYALEKFDKETRKELMSL